MLTAPGSTGGLGEGSGAAKDDISAVPVSRLAVLGDPIAHSRSPRIHRAAFGELGHPWTYTHVRVGESGLRSFLDGRGPEWRGFSLTMPLKEEARRIARVLDPVAEESGVVNTLLRLSGDAGWAGFNTDVGGLAAAIRSAGLDASRTIVIGSGATAVSAILAARRLGAQHVEMVARNVEAVGDLVARFGGTREPGAETPLHVTGTNLRFPEAVSVLTEMGLCVEDTCAGGSSEIVAPTLVISTLPGSASAQLQLPEALTRIPLFDVAYDPWPSPLAERWRAAGGDAHPGLGMLVEQALLQLRIFTGGDPSLPVPNEDRVLAAMRAAASGPVDMGG